MVLDLGAYVLFLDRDAHKIVRFNPLRWLAYAVSVGIAAWLLLVIFPALADPSEGATLLLEHMQAADLLWACALLVAYLLTHAMTLKIAAPRLRLRAATTVRAVNGGIGRIFPAGWAVGTGALVAMLSSLGLSATQLGHAIAVTAAWNALTKVSLPLLGLLAVLVVGTTELEAPLFIAAAAVAGVLLVLAVIWAFGHKKLGRRLGDLVTPPLNWLFRIWGRQPPEEVPDKIVAFQVSTGEALRDKPTTMALWYYAHHATHVALVWLGMSIAARGSGVMLGFPELLTAFGVGYLLTGLPISPGGLGTLDVAVVAVLTAWGEDPAVVAAGLLVYRVAVYGLYVPVLISWPLWGRGGARRKRAPLG